MNTSSRQIELLAPAGNFLGFIGGLNGGADAFYLAGTKFGARAYADNFTEEEIKEVLFLAKLFDKKVYLTVNTLLKNTEMKELYDYIKPLYELGLTGVIIQDFGVFEYLKEHFPGLELHASTQMTITSLEGAKYLIDQGMQRVVLARELTLKEVKEITDAGIETECFIHGSMCYCYSGQCLFSSLIGGRSGNRGRCAQPCRLPYKTGAKGKEEYCLSLKDMCTLEHLPELIESGIASFKIEGRMKNPAYAAWVTHIYRKYIDKYLANPNAKFVVDVKDLEQLKTLYIRTALQDGYYHKYRGENMITKESPAYSKTDETFVEEITNSLILTKPKKQVSFRADFRIGEPCSLYAETIISDKVYSAYVTGSEVQEAMKAPLSKESIEERLMKTGDSYFAVNDMEVLTDGNIFLPVKAINELRRETLEELQKSIMADIKAERVAHSRKKDDFSSINKTFNAEYIGFVEEREQLMAVLDAEYIERVVIPYGWLLADDSEVLCKKCQNAEKEVYFSLPAVSRSESFERIDKALSKAREMCVGEGVYVNQTDTMAHILEHFPELKCIGDLNLYAMNNSSVNWLMQRINGFTMPVELNKDELRHLNTEKGEFILYGRTPLMQTANCIFLTGKNCKQGKESVVGMMTDRTGAKIPFRAHCDERICYNTIYNNVPTSLHKHKNITDSFGVSTYQIRFTVETADETRKVLDFYTDYRKNRIAEDVPFAYTNGHFLRGVQ